MQPPEPMRHHSTLAAQMQTRCNVSMDAVGTASAAFPATVDAMPAIASSWAATTADAGAAGDASIPKQGQRSKQTTQDKIEFGRLMAHWT